MEKKDLNLELIKKAAQKIIEGKLEDISTLEEVNVMSDLDSIIEYNGKLMSINEYNKLKEKEEKENKDKDKLNK